MQKTFGKEQELTDAVNALLLSSQIIGFPWTKEAAMLTIMDLLNDHYSFDSIIKALHQCRKTVRRSLCQNDIYQYLWNTDTRPSPDEAWCLCVHLLDHGEAASKVITDEIITAFDAVSESYKTNPVGARISFLAVYQQKVQENRHRHVPVHWFLSAGTDKEDRKKALIEAITNQHLCEQLPVLMEESGIEWDDVTKKITILKGQQNKEQQEMIQRFMELPRIANDVSSKKDSVFKHIQTDPN